MSHAASRNKPRVLIVEDDVDTRDLLILILEDEGYQVDAVDDGRKVAGRVKLARPDVITLDIGLPGKSGKSVLDDLERDPATANIPVVVISGNTKKLAGPDRAHTSHVIAKPFYVTQVLEEIERALVKPE
ncbi:MAG: response regulator [Chloroflexota bacterium]